MLTAKLDLKRTLKELYNPPFTHFTVVDVPPANFLMLDGRGDPDGMEFKQAMESMYAVAYGVKFAVKKQGDDYVVMPPEGLWWADSPEHFHLRNRDAWQWTVLIRQPDFVSAEVVDQVVAEVRKKKNPVALPKLRFERYHEGLSVQIMHIGSYAEEAPTLAKLHNEFMPAQGYDFAGKHHEIYLGDPDKTPSNKLKTVLRQPVKAK